MIVIFFCARTLLRNEMVDPSNIIGIQPIQQTPIATSSLSPPMLNLVPSTATSTSNSTANSTSTRNSISTVSSKNYSSNIAWITCQKD